LTGFKPVTHHQNFLNVVEGGEIKHLFKELFGEEPYSLDTKWVRVLGPKEATSTHSDYYRFKKLGIPLYTCWIPLMDQGLKEGTLGICENTFKLEFEGEPLENEEVPESF